MAYSALNRILKIFNYLVGVAVVLLLAAGWWYVYRPLPKTSGSIAAPVTGKVSITRDAVGVPHIRADREEDALFAQGYVTAQDRLFQMDGLRRLSGGTLSEVAGPRAIESDRDSRRLRTRRLAEAAYLQLTPANRAALAAYTRGVNHFISTHQSNLPIEFTLLGYHPRPWSAVDSLLIGLHMFRTLTTTWKDEVAKRNLMTTGDAKKVEFLFPASSGGDAQPGSNGWVLAGRRTASGKPLLSNDMHLEWSFPGIWYMAHIEAGSLNVAGVTLPGMPGVIVGHNRRVAWGITSLQADMQDLYQEKFDDRTGRYLFRDQAEQARVEREFVEVKGGQRIELVQYVTRHGPIFIADGQDRLSLRWVAAESGALQLSVLDLNRAENWQQFTSALAQWSGPGLNFIYADVDGNIGYHAAGKIPIRRKYRGDLPVEGWTGESEWDGFIPFEQLPQSFNPPSGMIVSANQNPFPSDYPYNINGNFAPYHRHRQIQDLLKARTGWKAEEMLAVQTDLYSSFSKYLAGELVAAYDRRKATNPALSDAIRLLREWNGQMHQDLAAPFLAALAYQHLRTAAAENASPGKGSIYEFNLAPTAIERLLRERPSGWFRDYDETLLRALVDAVEEGSRMQGKDANRWRYGAYLRLTLVNPVVHQIPWIGPYFDIANVPMSGSTTAVKQTTWRLGPSMRMNADLADWERSLLNLTAGQSGQILSSHYRDQWKHYYSGRSFPMQFGKVESKRVVELRPE